MMQYAPKRFGSCKGQGPRRVMTLTSLTRLEVDMKARIIKSVVDWLGLRVEAPMRIQGVGERYCILLGDVCILEIEDKSQSITVRTPDTDDDFLLFFSL